MVMVIGVFRRRYFGVRLNKRNVPEIKDKNQKGIKPIPAAIKKVDNPTKTPYLAFNLRFAIRTIPLPMIGTKKEARKPRAKSPN